MGIQHKQRLVGVAVVAVFALILLPFLFMGTKETPRPTPEVISVAHAPASVPASVPASPSAPAPSDIASNIAPAPAPTSIASVASPPLSVKKAASPTVTQAQPGRAKKAHKVQGSSAPAASAWAVHLGSFSKAGNAATLVRRLKAKGFSAHAQRIKAAKGSGWTQVYVGPEATRSRAVVLAGKIRRALHINGTVIRHTP